MSVAAHLQYLFFKSLYPNACMLQEKENLKVPHAVAKPDEYGAAAHAAAQHPAREPGQAAPRSPRGNLVIWRA